MAAKKRVPLHQNPRGFVEVDPAATEGAILGVNLRDPAGNVIPASAVLNPSSGGGGTNSISSTIWRLIREIPANIQKIAALVGKGFAVRRDDGEWALRMLQEGTGIDIANPDGEAGNPVIGLEDAGNTGAGALRTVTVDTKGRVIGWKAATITGTTNQINVADGDAVAGLPTISLADLANSGVGAALVKITRDAKGRVSGTEAATTDDLPAGATNKYFPEAPIDGQTYGRKDGAWALIPAGGGAVSSVNARTGAVTVPDFVSKATAPTSTDFGRALIEGDRWFNTTNGIEYSQVGGAWVYSNQAALSRYMPAYLAIQAERVHPHCAAGIRARRADAGEHYPRPDGA